MSSTFDEREFWGTPITRGNFYNEHDPKAAAWLRELIRQKLIPDGVVDERSIEDILPSDLDGFTQAHFFAGIGGWSRALQIAGISPDTRLWTGSCPCQPFSTAGKGAGTADERHLWPAFKWLIEQCQPPAAFGEQVASAAGREWLAGVRADLEGMAYDVGAADLCAAGVGAPHIRQRLFWVAHLQGQRLGERLQCDGNAAQDPADGSSHGPHIDGPCTDSGTGFDDDDFWGDGLEESSGRGLQGENQQPRDGTETHQQREADQSGTGSSHVNGRTPNTGSERRKWRQGAEEGSVADGQDAGRVEGDDGTQCIDHLGFWSNYELVPCRDGKARRIEPGSQPLVDGLPRGMVPVGDCSVQEAQATGEARVARLKGYGNAIVPEAAAQFILACEEAIGELLGVKS